MTTRFTMRAFSVDVSATAPQSLAVHRVLDYPQANLKAALQTAEVPAAWRLVASRKERRRQLSPLWDYEAPHQGLAAGIDRSLFHPDARAQSTAGSRHWLRPH